MYQKLVSVSTSSKTSTRLSPKMQTLLTVFSCALLTVVTAQKGQYVFDLLKPALNAAEVLNLLASRGVQWPTLNAVPDNINFDCASKKGSGFYADVSTQCQVFHRCDINGNLTSYICVNTTVFNQITLVCDYWYNVDCNGFAQYENFANSRLYQDGPLFDSPPPEYISPEQQRQQQQQIAQQQGQQQGAQQVVSPRKPASAARLATTRKPAVAATTAKRGVSVSGSAAISMGGRSDEEQSGIAVADASASNVDQVQDTTAAPEDTTAAVSEDTTATAEDTTTAETTTEASQ